VRKRTVIAKKVKKGPGRTEASPRRRENKKTEIKNGDGGYSLVIPKKLEFEGVQGRENGGFFKTKIGNGDIKGKKKDLVDLVGERWEGDQG